MRNEGHQTFASSCIYGLSNPHSTAEPPQKASKDGGQSARGEGHSFSTYSSILLFPARLSACWLSYISHLSLSSHHQASSSASSDVVHYPLHLFASRTSIHSSIPSNDRQIHPFTQLVLQTASGSNVLISYSVPHSNSSHRPQTTNFETIHLLSQPCI